MKLSYLAFSLLGSLVVAQSFIEDDCQCPQVKCPATDTLEGCRCVNLAELRCKQRCPNYTPTKFRICRRPKQTPTPLVLPLEPTFTSVVPEPTVPSSLELPDLPLVPDCECEERMCIQVFPDSCHCAYGIAKTCYDKCGGPSPGLNTCPPLNPHGGISLDGPVKRNAAPEPQSMVSELVAGLLKPKPVKTCKCEQTACVQSWPAGCYCAKAAKQACYRKCGGKKPAPMDCPGPKPKPTTKPVVDGSRKQRVCGGGRANTNPPCPGGYICMNDPFKSGCGLECDGTGICVKDELCGGFAGFRCPDSRQICADKPDDCDPENGGADCGGVCVWPPSLRTT